MPPVRRNLRLICAFHGLHMSLFPIAVITLFWRDTIGMTFVEIMLLQAFFGLVVAAFEVPSGYLADRLGYRRTLLLASLLGAAGWGLYAVAPDLATVIAAEVLLGIGLSLISGADAALLYESLLDLREEDEYTRWNGYYRFWGQAAEGTSALAAGLLFAWWDRLPFVLEVGVWLGAVAVAWALVEPERERASFAESSGQLRGMLRLALLDDARLRAVFLLSIALGLASFVPVWLIVPYAEAAGVPVPWLGPVWAAANYTVALGSLASAGLVRRVGLFGVLAACLALVGAGYVGLGLSEVVYGFAFYFCLTLMRGLNGPALSHEEQRRIPSRQRAGMLSLRSFAFRLSFMALGPFVGAAVDQHGQRPVLLVLGVGFTAVCGLALLLLTRTRAAEPTRTRLEPRSAEGERST